MKINLADENDVFSCSVREPVRRPIYADDFVAFVLVGLAQVRHWHLSPRFVVP
jgi:hypothetical protein